mgnify:CR=1 FL=1
MKAYRHPITHHYTFEHQDEHGETIVKNKHEIAGEVLDALKPYVDDHDTLNQLMTDVYKALDAEYDRLA